MELKDIKKQAKENRRRKMSDDFVRLYAEGYRTGHILEELGKRYILSIHTLYKLLKIEDLKKIANKINAK